MVCALYGILLFINQQTALTIESSMNWIFTFPVLIYTGMYGSNMGGIVAVAMAMMTFLFGGFTTWFYSWTSILIGFIYGIGLYKRWGHVLNFSICAILSVISSALIIYLWAGIFGYDLATEFADILAIAPWIHLQVLVFVFVILLGILQAFCSHDYFNDLCQTPCSNTSIRQYSGFSYTTLGRNCFCAHSGRLLFRPKCGKL